MWDYQTEAISLKWLRKMTILFFRWPKVILSRVPYLQGAISQQFVSKYVFPVKIWRLYIVGKLVCTNYHQLLQKLVSVFLLKWCWIFLKEKVFIYFFSNLGDYVSSLGWNFVCWTYLKPQEGRKVPFKGQSISRFQFSIFFTFKVFPHPTQTSDLRRFSDALHMFILYRNFWNNSTLNATLIKYSCTYYYLLRCTNTPLARNSVFKLGGACWSWQNSDANDN